MSSQWWRGAVVYQVYPRSFQDSTGDGEGDLQGVRRRLDHLERLGVDALWLSPIFPSPQADGGYDVADFCDVDPRFGTLADLDALIADAHDRHLRVLLDIVASHTSIEHPWFREHPERYVWSDRDGPQNNWVSNFGGPAWSRDARTGRWYLHSFYPEQPDLDWRRADVRAAIAGVLRFWRARGVDGFRLDAVARLAKDPELRDDPPATRPPPLPEHPEFATLDHVHSRNAAGIGDALSVLRDAAGAEAFLVAEAHLPTADLRPYVEHCDAAFAFELLHAPWTAGGLRGAIASAVADPALGGRLAWVLSNHDFARLPTRTGAGRERTGVLLALTLPGPVFLLQGDELGMPDGPGREPPDDRAGRDPHRHPMRWSDDEPHGGFTRAEATPWLPAIAVPGGGAAEQERDRSSILWLTRELIALRAELGDGLELVAADAGVVAYRRGEDHLVALNVAGAPRRAPPAGEVLVHTHGPVHGTAPSVLAPGAGFVARAIR